MMNNNLKKVNVSQIEIKVRESDLNENSKIARTQPDEIEEQKEQQKNATSDSLSNSNVDNNRGSLQIRSYTCTNFNQNESN